MLAGRFNGVRSSSTLDRWSTAKIRARQSINGSSVDEAHLRVAKRSSSTNLSPGQIGGIFVGCFVFVVLVLLLWLYVSRQHYSYRPRADSPSPPPSPPPPPPPVAPVGRGPRRPGGGRNAGGAAVPPSPPPPVPPEPVRPAGTGGQGVRRPVEALSLGYYEDDRRGRVGGWTRPRFRPADDDEEEGGPIFTWGRSKKSKSRARAKSGPHRVLVVEPE